MNDREILGKLVKIFQNQQKIFKKLAQKADPNIDYLQQAWEVIALNSGLTTVSSPQVFFNAGSTKGNTEISSTYTVNIPGVPVQANRQQLINSFKALIKKQKPELDGKVSIIFA